MQWAINKMLSWDRKETTMKVYHIHGDKDVVFPIKNIKGCHIVKNGTHAMLLYKYKDVTRKLIEILKN